MIAFLQVKCQCFASQAIRTLLFSGLPLLVIGSAWGQPRGVKEGELIQLAPAVTPHIYMATASKENDKVVVRVSAMEIRLKDTKGDKDAKGWLCCWTEQDPLVLGKQIRAYEPSGKAIDGPKLLKALSKPVAVACFQRTHKDDPETPDPFYAGVFRDDVVLLVFEAKYWLR